jgi:hypothetical protein
MLEGRIVAVQDLTERQVRTMFGLMRKYYANIAWEHFITDLGGKCDAVLLCDADGEIHGFTTLAVFPRDGGVQLLYSGDTIVEKAYWGNNDLPAAWVRNAFAHAELFSGRTYWLLLTKGYKTYKFLHTFVKEFYPRYDAETPPEIQALIDGFAREQFGGKYSGGVYSEGRDFLKEEFDDLSEAKLKNPHTAFFLEKNPNYRNGDELVCIAELCLCNLNRSGRRMLGR